MYTFDQERNCYLYVTAFKKSFNITHILYQSCHVLVQNKLPPFIYIIYRDCWNRSDRYLCQIDVL